MNQSLSEDRARVTSAWLKGWSRLPYSSDAMKPLGISRFHAESYLLAGIAPCLNSRIAHSSSLLESPCRLLWSFPPSSTGSTTRCPVNGHIPIADGKQQTRQRKAHNGSKNQPTLLPEMRRTREMKQLLFFRVFPQLLLSQQPSPCS